MSLPRMKIYSVMPSSICADCSAENTEWASLNRGVLICSDCCTVHRSLGRHVSQVRSLKKGTWHSSQLALIHALFNNGANNIWEHSLPESQNTGKMRKKPTPHDPLYPTKADFIRTKYADLAYAFKPNKDDGPLNLMDLNRQLWSCVRTAHVETTLRLLSLGADPNYVDPDRGTTPLHIAAKECQSLQVELLCIYGADCGRPNMSALTPGDVARLENHTELAVRFDELSFQVSNRLTMFLCGRKPDHAKQQHFLVPELTDHIADDRAGKEARRRLQQMLPIAFEKFVQDVYDEVDRRETDTTWLACCQSAPVSHLANERHLGQQIPDVPEQKKVDKSDKHSERGADYDDVPVEKSAKNEPRLDGIVSLDDYLELKDRVLDSEDKVDDMSRSNVDILKQLQLLHTTVDRLNNENVQLRMNLHKGLDQFRTELPPKSFSTRDSRLIRRHASLSSPVGFPPSPSYLIRNGSAPPNDPPIPLQSLALIYPDNLIIETEKLTIAIKQLLTDAQQGRLGQFASRHADTIGTIIDGLARLVPLKFRTNSMEKCLSMINGTCLALTNKCGEYPVEVELTCQAAYGVAKSAKQLLTAIQQ